MGAPATCEAKVWALALCSLLAAAPNSPCIDVDDPAMQRVSPLRVPRPKLAAEEVAIQQALLSATPESFIDPAFIPTLRDLVEEVTGMRIDLWFHSLRYCSHRQLKTIMPGYTCLVVLGVAPLSEKLLLECDPMFAYRSIHALLGGVDPLIQSHRPLTEIEQGVFSYLALRVLSLAQGQLPRPEEMALRLEDIRPDLESAADIVATDERWLILNFKANFDLDVGFFRLAVPARLATQVLQKSSGPELRGGHHLPWVRQRLPRLRGLRTEARITAGHVALSPDDVAHLDAGDIIILEDCAATLSDHGLSGPAELRLREPSSAVVEGTLGVDGGAHAFTIGRIRAEPAARGPDQAGAPAPSAAAEPVTDEHIEEEQQVGDQEPHDEPEEAVTDADNLPETEALLGDMPLDMAVEVGRVALSANDVIRLRSGQVIRLARSPADPVDLVIQGRLIGHGELVEIDGAVGVRVLSLVEPTP